MLYYYYIRDPHSLPPKMIYQKLSSYQMRKGWEDDQKIIKLVSYVIKFLYVHHYYDEGVAIVDELKTEKGIN